MPGITESAGLPLLATVAVTVMVSPGLTLAPIGPGGGQSGDGERHAAHLDGERLRQHVGRRWSCR